MKDQEKSKPVELVEIPSISLPTAVISENTSATVQEAVLEKTMTIEPEKQAHFIVVKKTKSITKPKKQDLKKRQKTKKGQKAAKPFK